MKILLCSWECICEKGIIDAFRALGHEVIVYENEPQDNDYDTEFLKALISYVQQNYTPDFLFTANYAPIIARACKLLKIPYISWVVDCPLLTLFSETISYDTNYVFVLDRLQASQIEPYNPGHIFHLPLACDVDYFDSIKIDENDKKAYSHDVSFVGSLYIEKNENKYTQYAPQLPDYMLGYIDALVAAQNNVYGYNFVDDAISDDWVKKFVNYTGIEFRPDYYNDPKYFISQYIINYKCAEISRISTLNTLAKYFDTHLYTLSDVSVLNNVNCHGPADSLTVMPKIFKLSKINLNMTLPSIQSGVPLRIFDVLGCGGFLITNYQPEVAELFEIDKDLVVYESIPDLINKVSYYLEHEEERLEIARNGYEKVKKLYGYKEQIRIIEKTLQLDENFK